MDSGHHNCHFPPLPLSPKCESNSGLVKCPTPRPLTVRGGPLVIRMFLLLLDLFGIQGFVFLFGGLLLVLGFVKLFFGRVLFCRKSKSDTFKDSLRERGEPLGARKKGGEGHAP